MTPDATAIAVSLQIGEYDETRKMIGKQRADEYNKTLLADKIAEVSELVQMCFKANLVVLTDWNSRFMICEDMQRRLTLS